MEKALIESLSFSPIRRSGHHGLVSWILDQDATFSAVRDHQKPFRTHPLCAGQTVSVSGGRQPSGR
ncbi:MAG: hypothetical protein ACLSFJ_00870 [Holdemania filiformis]